MRQWLAVLPLACAMGCSNLDDGDSIAIELRVASPTDLNLGVGEQVQLAAQAFNANGDVVETPVTWRAADATVTVGETTGLVTGVSPGPGRVQASAGSLSSDFVNFTVTARADTLIIVGDSVVAVPVEPGQTPPLVVRVETFNPAGPLAGQDVVYQITQPVAGDAPVVALSGDLQTVTAETGADGTVSAIQLNRRADTSAPDTAIVEVGATRGDGSAVPGSGQRFIVLFQ